jgi:ribose/xylose/arabinose/galactoside ABC-type transport system permease subunit
LYISDGQSIPILDERLIAVTHAGPITALPVILVYAFAIFVFATLLHEKTRFGRILFSIGRDETNAHLLGAPLNRVKIMAFAFSGLFAGMAGTLLMSRLGTGAASMGDYLMLETITAVVIGGTAITGGAGGVRLTILGVAIIVVLSNGMNIISLHPYIQTLVKGLAILAAVYVTSRQTRAEDVK